MISAQLTPFALTLKKNIPSSVMQVSQFLQSKGVWHLISKNHRVRSCKDAANKRNRLGHTGIPLSDELKTFLGCYRDHNNNLRIGLIHCRGNMQIDFGKVRSALGISSQFKRLESSDIAQYPHSLSLDYGLINPFLISEKFNGLPITQVFDKHTQKELGLPNTMMTNAGNLNWGVEFNCRELVAALPKSHVIVADVVAQSDVIQPQYTPIGIITGNSPDSGIELWKQINCKVKDRYKNFFNGDLSYPPVFIHSLPGMGLSMELDIREKQVWNIIEPSVESLCKQGAKIITLACNTTSVFTPQIHQICGKYNVHFVSILDSMQHYLREHNISKASILGINYVAECKTYSTYKSIKDIVQVQPISEAAQRRVQDLAYLVKKEGVNNAGLQKLRDIIRHDTNVQHVIIALTELSVLLANQKKIVKSQRTLLDSLEIYSQHIADTYLTLAQPRELYENVNNA